MVDFIEVAVHAEWVSNVVPIVKKNGKIKVISLESLKDEYLMRMVDLLVYSST